MMSNYTEQAEQLLKDCGVTIEIEYDGCNYYFDGDTMLRDICNFKIKRNGKKYSARFGQSIKATD